MYKFRLETILNHRKNEEEKLQKELSDLNLVLLDEQKKKEIIEKNKKNVISNLQDNSTKAISRELIIMGYDYLNKLDHDLKEQHMKVIIAENEVNIKKQELTEALKKRKILEKLKIKGLENYKQKILKDEMLFINEIAINRFNRTSLEK